MPNLWKATMSKHIDTRKKIKDIADVSSFRKLIDSATLSDVNPIPA